MSDGIVTKREILLSIAIICIMLLFGVLIGDAINDSVMEKHHEYNTALQINEDKELFEYGMRTNVGNAFVYGELKAVDPVGYEEIEGEYSYIKKVKEKHTKHTRVVTKTRTVNGKKQTYTETETYWTWDVVNKESKMCKEISFCDVVFNSNKIVLPRSGHITTIKESYYIRHKYYGLKTKYTGTIFAELKDNTIPKDTMFYNNKNIEDVMESLKSDWQLVVFWLVWILLIVGCVFVFYYIDNNWLEDER